MFAIPWLLDMKTWSTVCSYLIPMIVTSWPQLPTTPDAHVDGTAPEWTALTGGLKVLGINYDDSKQGLFTDKPGVLTNDYFRVVTSMDYEWKPRNGERLFDISKRTPKSKRRKKSLLSSAEVEEMYSILRDHMPGRTKTAKGPKGQPNRFRSCNSCMLSAQSRDTKTREATGALFKLARTPRTMLKLLHDKIAKAIKPCGLYNNKAKNIHSFCNALREEFDGIVPQTRTELMSLSGRSPIGWPLESGQSFSRAPLCSFSL